MVILLLWIYVLLAWVGTQHRCWVLCKQLTVKRELDLRLDGSAQMLLDRTILMPMFTQTTTDSDMYAIPLLGFWEISCNVGFGASNAA